MRFIGISLANEEARNSLFSIDPANDAALVEMLLVLS